VAEPAIEAVFETSAESRAELAARVQELEKRLELLGSRVGALRRSFQDMAIAADERLAAMEDEIEQVRSERDET
jgi:predicted  nucleic acid-binding Zn-ribbon protein